MITTLYILLFPSISSRDISVYLLVMLSALISAAFWSTWRCPRLSSVEYVTISVCDRSDMPSTRKEVSQQIWDAGPMLVCCCPDVVDGGPTSNQHWVTVSYLLGYCSAKPKGSNCLLFKALNLPLHGTVLHGWWSDKNEDESTWTVLER